MKTNHDTLRVLYTAILRLLRPLIRLSMKRGISYATFISLVKWGYYKVAEKDFTIEGRKQTHSRISVLTGFSRKEVKRLSELDPPTSNEQLEEYNRCARVISAWQREEGFVDDQGEPIVIPVYGTGATFETLVRKFSGDIPARAVMDELVQVGAVIPQSDQRIRLIKDAFVPTHNEASKFQILGTDVGLLISTIENNIELNSDTPFLQRKVYYDNIPGEVLHDIRRMSIKTGRKLINEMDRYIAINDRDVNPELEGDGRNIAGIGIYYFEKPYKDTD